MTETTPFVTIEELASHFALSLSTVRKWVVSGAIPRDTYIKVGRTYRFKLGEVEQALINNNVSRNDADDDQLEFDFGDEE